MKKVDIKNVFVDMDGVVSDFNKRYQELFNMLPREAEKNKNFYPLFKEFIAQGNFATLDLMSGAMEGVDYLRRVNAKVQMLSSTANEELYDDVSKQKLIWLQNHGISFPPIFVPGKKHKYKYATPDSIIIDDTESVIDDWREAGGIGILHKNWDTTLQILRVYI